MPNDRPIDQSAPTIRGAPVPGQRSITEAEKLAAAKLGDFPIRRDQMAAVANI